MNYRLKSRKRSKIVFYLMLFLILFVFIGIGFSISETNLEVRGITSMRNNLWDVHFENISLSSDSVVATIPAEISSSDPTKINFGVKLEFGMKYSFTVDVVNKGTLNAKISSIDLSGLTSSQKKYLDVNVTYDNGSTISVGDILPPNSSQKILVTIKYRDDLTDLSLYPENKQNTQMYYKISYVQQSGTVTIQNWDVHFDNINVLSNSAISANANINSIDPTKINFNIKYNMPGQLYSFSVDVVNNSEYDAYVSSAQLIGLTEEQKKYIYFTITDSEGNVINANDVLSANSSKKFIITITYASGLNDSEYPTKNQLMSLEYKMEYRQS